MISRQRRIAVLLHETDRHLPAGRYVIDDLAAHWRSWGLGVEFVYGVGDLRPADVLIVHVDLSVVPDEYLDYAARYAVTVNAEIRDIRKSQISSNIVSFGDDWDGPVIVKSDLNYGGLPESSLQQAAFAARWPGMKSIQSRVTRLRKRLGKYARLSEYEIFPQLSNVPPRILRDKRLVTEKFLPEIRDGLYFTSIYQFLGDKQYCHRIASKDPIIKATNAVSVERIEPDVKCAEWRNELQMDYGKLDYLHHDGQAILLDANKTIGISTSGMNQLVADEQVQVNRRTLAEGIFHYL